jgi:hypothetical protein
MNSCDVLALLIIICIFLLYSYRLEIDAFINRKPLCNNIDGRCYPVFEHFQNTMSASEMLAHLNAFAIKLMRHLRKKYLWNHQGTHAAKHMVVNLLTNYNPDSIVENNPDSQEFTSYVEDKGKVFAMCLREKNTGRNILHDKNILEFVCMHEMSHMASDEIGHETPEFWTNFKRLLENAKEIGIHIPINYAIYPVNYCSLHVDYNPYFDSSLITN